MKNLKYVFTIALFLLILACNQGADCLSPYNDCNCPEGYEGTNCATKSTSQFLGQYYPEFRSPTDTNYIMTVLDSTTQTKRVYFKRLNLSNDYIVNFYGIVDGQHIIVPQQAPSFSFNVKQIEGEGCLQKTGTQQGLIMKLTFNGNNLSPYRIAYIKNKDNKC